MIKNTSRGAVLSEQAMLCSVSISRASDFIVDKRTGDDIAKQKNASRRATHVRKRILDGAFPATQHASSRIRDIYYQYTFELPRSGGGQSRGPRLLPVATAERFLDEIGVAIESFNSCADRECDALPEFVARSTGRLGDLYSADEFPSSEQAREKFNATVSLDGLPSVEHINAGKHQTAVVAEAQKRQAAISSSVTKQLLVRVLENTAHLADKLESGGKIFDSVFTNLRDALDIADASDIDGDPQLATLVRRARRALVYTPDQVRNAKSARQHTAKIAQDVASLAGQAVRDSGAVVTKSVAKKASAYL